ncbi:hypothetical protein AAHH88_00490 [Candidatus Hodgkinia cicadicola]
MLPSGLCLRFCLVLLQAVSLYEAVFKSLIEVGVSLALTSLCVIICNWVGAWANSVWSIELDY